MNTASRSTGTLSPEPCSYIAFRQLLALALLITVAAEMPTAAAIKTWVGEASNNNFSANANWYPSGSPGTAAPGDDIVFGSDNSEKPNMNDLAGTSTNYSSVTFTNGGFTIRTAGDGRLMQIKAGSGITNQTGFVNGDNEIKPHVVMLGAMTVLNNNATSKLIFNPDDRNLEKYSIDARGNTLTFDGPGNFTIGDALPNVGEMRNVGSLIKKGAGCLELCGTNTWSGNCSIQAGTFRLSSVNQLQGSVSVANGATFSAKIDYPGTTLRAQGLTLGTSAGDFVTNTFDFGALGTPIANVVSVGTLTVNGTVKVNVTGWGLRPGQFALIKYQTLNGDATRFVSNSFPRGVSGCISNNVINKSIDLVISGPVMPVQADQFVDSIGVNTHITISSNPDFAMYAYSNTLAAVKALGLRHIRDGFADWNNDLGSNGIHLAVAIGGVSSSQIDGYVASLLAEANRINPGVLDWIEGVNEPNIFDLFMSPQEIVDLQKALWTAFKADPNQCNLPILLPPLAITQSGNSYYTNAQDLSRQLAALGIHQYGDYANGHPYPNSWHMPEGLPRIAEDFEINQRLGPDLPLIVTEVQYSTPTPANGRAVDEWAAGIFTPRFLLDLHDRGVEKSYIYELFDVPNEGDNNFRFAGLYHSDGTTPGSIKPQGIALKNMIALLSDPGQSFQVTGLDFDVSGGGALRSKLFQKRNGEYWLALWRPVDVGFWDGTNFVHSYPATQNATLTIKGGFVPTGIMTYTDLSSETPTTATLVPAASVTIPEVGGMVKFVKIIGSASGTPVRTVIHRPCLDESGKLVLAGTNLTATAGGSYSVLSSTNVAAPLSMWKTNVSGMFGSGGSFSNVISLDPTKAQFFMIKTP